MWILLIISIWANMYLFVKYIKEKNERIRMKVLLHKTARALDRMKERQDKVEKEMQKTINLNNHRIEKHNKDYIWK